MELMRAGTRRRILDRLGLMPGERAVVLHADDIGMCHATVRAYGDLLEHGIVKSASAMVPSPWFPAVAGLASGARAGHVDLGVHLTLNSEWPTYRMAPVLGSEAFSLCDGHGYLHAAADGTHRLGRAAHVRIELLAQVARARACGVDVTHIDSHMLTLFHPTLFETYVGLSRELRLPATLIRMSIPGMASLCGIATTDAALVCERLAAADDDGLVAFDAWAEMPLDRHAGRLDDAIRRLDSLPEGLSMFVLHPAVDGDELRAIAPDWRSRVADHALCCDDRWRRAVEAAGVRVIGMRTVCQAMMG